MIITSWTVGDSLYPLEVRYGTVAITVAAATLSEFLPADTSTHTITGTPADPLQASTTYAVFVRHRDDYGGVSPAATTTVTTGATGATLTAPDEIQIMIGANVATRTAT
jgi:hypothetical protein